MFEMTISTSRETGKDISYIIEKLRTSLKSLKAILVCEEFDGRINLAIAVNENKKDLMTSFVFDAISESIIRNYKERFLFNNIDISSVDELTKTAFVKALTLFDKESDKQIIKSQLTPFKELAMDSFYHFRLKKLEKRWKDIATLVSESSGYLVMNGSFEELMRFLIMTNENEFGELHLYYKNYKIIATSREGELVFSFNYTDDERDKIRVVSEIISLSPGKIVLHKELSGFGVSKFLENIYCGKISVLK